LESIGKTLVMLGVLLVISGVVVWGLGQIPRVGRLPGDVYFRRGTTSFYFPITTCIILSIVLSLLFSLFRR